jgi:hypothetical protein
MEPIIVPGGEQPSRIDQMMYAVAMRLDAIEQTLQMLAMRMQMLQTVLLDKKLIIEDELKLEYNKIVEEIKKQQSKSKILTPDGRQHIVEPGTGRA